MAKVDELHAAWQQARDEAAVALTDWYQAVVKGKGLSVATDALEGRVRDTEQAVAVAFRAYLDARGATTKGQRTQEVTG